MPRVKTYSFKNWKVTVAGVPIQGYAKDNGIKIAWSEAFFSKTVGLDGEITRNGKHDFSADITLNLASSSDSNVLLESLLLADVVSQPKLNATTFTVTVTYLGLPAKSYVANECWIEKPADEDGSAELSDREWKIHCPALLPIDPLGLIAGVV